MGRNRSRTWDASPLADAVETVGGIKFAAAYCDVTEEGIVIALQRGYLTNARAVICMAEETLRRGKPVSMKALAGMEQTQTPPRTDGRAPAQKGGTRRRTTGCSPTRLSSVRSASLMAA